MVISMKKLCYFLALFLAFIDQLVKFFIRRNMHLYESIPVIKEFFSITYVRNTGGAFSILQNKTYLLLIIAFVVLFFLIGYIEKQKELKKVEAISLGMLLGGIVGNLIDRLVEGQVIDYFDFNIFGYAYPVFNLADCFIVIGILFMCYFIIRSDIYDRRRKRGEHKA